MTLMLLNQAAQATLQVQIIDPWLLKLGAAGGAIALAVGAWLVKLLLALSKKTDAFFVTWYGDPSDKSGKPNGAKNKLYDMADDVSHLKEWSRGYDRALGALSEDNDRLRAVWHEGDPERRREPRP